MKICLDTKCRRRGIELPFSEFPKNNARPDKHNGYCRECSRRKTNECRDKMRPFRAAKKRLAQERRRQERELAAQNQPTPVEIVKDAIKNGSRTRNAIRAKTRLPWDDISEALRELVLDERTVRVERVGRLGFFVPAKAA